MSFIESLEAAYRGKKVFVTGHTGFKGSWLCEWLLMLGANVRGFSLPPEEPSLFSQLHLASRLTHEIGDIRNPGALAAAIRDFQPDYVFHLAAQALVRASYDKPVETFETNAIGTLHLLEALRPLQNSSAAVFVTTDKCYENREWLHGYREEDKLGGKDPYSASKAMAELVIASCRASFFTSPGAARIASARAGNVIGGGDWALDRIVPDAMRALEKGQPIPVRNRHATRPWQHVLEPLGGYLLLAMRLKDNPEAHLRSPFNFGPWTNSNRPVGELVEEILKHWPGTWLDQSDPVAPHEAHLLHLSIDKAYHVLGWHPVWDFETTIAKTVEWYRRQASGEEAADTLTRQHIQGYCALAKSVVSVGSLCSGG